MRHSIAAFALLALALTAEANDGNEVSLRNRALASAVTPKHADAPFAQGRDPMPQLLMAEERESRSVRGTCEGSVKDVCYDLADGRVVYRGARAYMPKLTGLTPEAVSLRHNRVVVKYSFR
jgi:hypothetical protein